MLLHVLGPGEVVVLGAVQNGLDSDVELFVEVESDFPESDAVVPRSGGPLALGVLDGLVVGSLQSQVKEIVVVLDALDLGFEGLLDVRESLLVESGSHSELELVVVGPLSDLGLESLLVVSSELGDLVLKRDPDGVGFSLETVAGFSQRTVLIVDSQPGLGGLSFDVGLQRGFVGDLDLVDVALVPLGHFGDLVVGPLLVLADGELVVGSDRDESLAVLVGGSDVFVPHLLVVLELVPELFEM